MTARAKLTMRLLLISSEFPPGPGGIGTHAFQLATHLQRLGWEVRVVSPQDYVSDEEVTAFNERQPYAVVRLPSRQIPPVKLVRRLGTVRREITSFAPDGVVASGKGAAWLAAAVGGISKVPWCAVGHGTEFGLTGRIPRALTRWAFERATATISVSRYTELQMRRLGVRPRDSYVIHNGADDDRYRLLEEDEVARFREARGWSDKRLLLTVGRVSERKGQDVVIEALPRVLREVPNAHYLIAGLPERREDYEELARSLGVDAHVHFLGRVDVDTAIRLQNSSDVFVMTSRRTADGDVEGFGIAAVEAALCGTPAVVSDGSGLVEAIVDGETGVAVPMDDPPATADALVRLLTDEPMRREMARAARIRATQEQTWARCVKQYDTLLRRIFHSKGSDS